MKNLLRSGLLVMSLAIASCSAVLASPRASAKIENTKVDQVSVFTHVSDYAVVNTPVVSFDSFYVPGKEFVFSLNAYATCPAIKPAKIASVPKTKVFSLKKYFGMSVGSDISHNYTRADIRYWSHPCVLNLPLPPIIS